MNIFTNRSFLCAYENSTLPGPCAQKVKTNSGWLRGCLGKEEAGEERGR